MHYSRFRKNGTLTVAPRPNYGSGRSPDSSGYIRVWRPGHPLADATGYVLEHRLVMWEHGIDPRGFDVHHRNEDKTDNRYENLKLATPSDHTKEHAEAGTSNQYGRWDPLPDVCDGRSVSSGLKASEIP